MAKELLKEAIADAKAVREVALQNAKMALEEAFDSKIKNMLSAKLAEEIGEDTLDEDYLDEEMDDSDDVDDVSAATESESFDEEINLDELMAELEEDSYEEGADEGINEDASEEDIAKLEKSLGENAGSLNESAVLGLSIISSMGGILAVHTLFNSDSALGKKYPKAAKYVDMLSKITNVTKEGVKKDDEGINEDASEEDIAKLEKSLGENTDGVNESVIAALVGVPALIAAAGGIQALQDKVKDKEWAAKYPKIAKLMDFMEKTGSAMASGKNEAFKKDDEAVEENVDIDALIAEIEREAELEEGATGYDDKVGGKGRTGFDNKPGGKGGTGYDSKKVKQLKEERNAAIATVRSLKGTITEMNLLNSKLLYCNKLFKANSLTEAQKVKVIDALDLASTTNEAKLVFTTLQESFNFTGVEKRSIREGLGRASKASGNAPKKVITESVDGTISRFQKLANIKF
jgi:hypothetical protein